MKILFKEGKYSKVSDDLEAEQKVQKFGYKYVPRSEWKKNVRDVKKEEIKLVENIVKEKKKRKK